MKPSIGRIVHYVSYGTPGGEFKSVCRAAIISDVFEDGTVGLCVLNPMGVFFNQLVPYSAQVLPGTWHWPEHVE